MLRIVLAAVAALAAPVAGAAEITFDTVPSGTVIDTTYAPLGVAFFGATVEDLANAGIATSTPPKAAVNSATYVMSFRFTGKLPSVVSFTVSTAARDSVQAVAYLADGGTKTFRTGGAAGPGSTPYVPNQLVRFAAAGIQKITVYDFFSLRNDIGLDTLRFSAGSVQPPSYTSRP
jgi:hypothetical protein